VRGTLCDSWSSLDLDPFGFEERTREPWFVRPARELPNEEVPPELEVVEVATEDEVVEFEDVSARGFGGEDATVETPFHPPAILGDARMRMLTGRVGGTAVAAAMSYGGSTAVGVYGVTTIASARRRGYASALTRALIEPSRPTVLSPSPEAESLYRRLGFERVGELCQWTSRREQA
jgi:ribosomal protein S18 acetylase RimI-like enzyme